MAVGLQSGWHGHLETHFRSSFATLSMLVVVGPVSLTAVQLISVADEIQLGRDAQVEVRRHVPEVRDPVVRGYVEDLGTRLVPHAGGAAYPYSFSTADAREVNAFALPGGPIWINRGVLEIADDDAQVAGVLAHEIAHIAGRHTRGADDARGLDQRCAGGAGPDRRTGGLAERRHPRSARWWPAVAR